MTKKLKTSTEFVPDKNEIEWVGPNFKEHLYDLTFTAKEAKGLMTRMLGNHMLDSEIFATFGPETVELGEVLAYLKDADRNGWYIFYVNDSKGVKWAVSADWVDHGWNVEASSVSSPNKWGADGRVVSGRFSDSQNKTLSPSDTLPDELIVNGRKYKAV